LVIVYSLLVFSLLCFGLAFGFSTSAMAELFNPGLMMTDPETMLLGAFILKLLLIFDGIILVVVAIAYSRQWLRLPSNYAPLWSPRGQSAEPLSFYYPLLLSLLLMAAILRFIAVDSDLWMDEVFTLVESARLGFGEIFSSYKGDNQHTLYVLLANCAINVLGESAFSLRLPAVLFGIASIWAVARLAKLVFGDRVALISVLLLSFSYHHIWFSQNARAYTLLLFTTVLSLDFLLRGLRSGEWKYWLAYAVTIALGAWAHLTGVFVAMAHVPVIVVILIHQGRLMSDGGRPLVALLLAAWLTLHFYGLGLPQIFDFFTQSVGAVKPAVEWTSPLWLINEILARIGMPVSVGWAGLLMLSLPGLFILYYLMRRDWVFVSLAIMPGLLLAVVMIAMGRNLWPRMFFNEAGVIIILLVVTGLAIGDWLVKLLTGSFSKIRYLPLSVLALIFILTLPKLYKYPKQNYTGARDYVLGQMGPGDTVYGLLHAGHVYSLYYAPQWEQLNTLEQLEANRNQHGDTWVLYTLPDLINNAMPELAKGLEAGYDVVEVFPGTLGDGEIIVLRSK
jgi:uncharacterized membrane protein